MTHGQCDARHSVTFPAIRHGCRVTDIKLYCLASYVQPVFKLVGLLLSAIVFLFQNKPFSFLHSTFLEMVCNCHYICSAVCLFSVVMPDWVGKVTKKGNIGAGFLSVRFPYYCCTSSVGALMLTGQNYILALIVPQVDCWQSVAQVSRC